MEGVLGNGRVRLRRCAQGTALSLGQHPNELWCTDYQGEFLLGNRQYCYMLSVTDHASLHNGAGLQGKPYVFLGL
jgi:hypothetical protein